MVVLASNKALTATGTAAVGCPMADGASSCAPPCCSRTLPFAQPSKAPSKASSYSLLPATECSLGSGCPVAERYRERRHSRTMCGREKAGKLTCESHSVGEHSAAAPAVVSAQSQLSATRLAKLLRDGRRWVPLLLAHVVVC